LVVEQSLRPEVLAELSARGHRVVEVPAWSIGRVTAVGVDSQGFLIAGADPRNGQAYATGR
jgi:gamma-glutamyltranspeptidase/glutathione hydrolase